MFKICLIGCGNMSSAVHGPSMKKYKMEHTETSLGACCDLDPVKAKEYCEKFGFERFYTDMDKMLDIEQPDAVSLIAPEELTAGMAVRIIEKGYPLIMEKPPGENALECRRIISAAKNNNVSAQVAFNRRYIPIYRLLKTYFDYSKTEDIQFVKYELKRIDRCNEEFSATAIHAIDAVRFFTGSDYREIEFLYHEIPKTEALNVYMYCRMQSGINVFININPCIGYNRETCEFALQGRSFFADMWRGKFKLKTTEANKEEIIKDCSSEKYYISGGFYDENKQFFNDIREHGVISSGGVADALQSVEVSDCYREMKKEFNA